MQSLNHIPRRRAIIVELSKNFPRTSVTFTLEFRIDWTPRLLYISFLPPSPTLFDTSRLLILDNFASLPFYSRISVY